MIFKRRRIKDGVQRVLEEVSTLLPDDNVSDAQSLIEHDEWGVALELLCTQLYEYEVSISKETFLNIVELMQQMGKQSSEWEYLEELTKNWRGPTTR